MKYLCSMCDDTFKSIKAKKEHEMFVHHSECDVCHKVKGEVRLDDRGIVTCEDCAVVDLEV